MPNCFQGQTYVASSYIVLDVMAERWPVVFSGYELICFLDIKVACQRIVVMPANKLYPDDFRDIREALIMQHAINVVPVGTAWLLSSNLPSLVVLILEFLQPQLHQADAGLVKFFVRQLVLKRFPELV